MEIILGLTLSFICVILGVSADLLREILKELRKANTEPRKAVIVPGVRGIPASRGTGRSGTTVEGESESRRMTPTEFAEASRIANIKKLREEEHRKNAG